MRIHDRVELGLEAWGRLVVRHARLVGWLVVAASVAIASFLPDLRADNSTESFLRPNDPARLIYDDFRAQFGQDERIVLLVETDGIFTLENLERVRALHEALELRVPHVEEITSLWNARHTRGEGEELIVEDLLADWPSDAVQVEEIRQRVLDTPVYHDSLVDAELAITAISLEPLIYSPAGASADALDGFDEAATGDAEPPLLTEAEVVALLNGLEATVAAFDAPGFRLSFSGGPVLNRFATRYMTRDVVNSLSIGVVVIGLLLGLLFRRITAVVLPLVVMVTAVIVTFGIMAILDIPTSISGAVLPLLVLIVGACSAIHVLNVVYRRIAEGVSQADAIVGALRHSGLSILMAALTTAGGLLSFAFAELAQVRNLGLAAPIGILLTFVYSVTLLPAALMGVRLRPPRPAGRKIQERVAAALVRAGDASARRPWPVLGITALLVVIAGAGVAQLRFSQNGLEWFPEGDTMRVAAETLNERLGGASGLELWLDTGREGGVRDPEFLARVERATAFAETLREGEVAVGKSLSLVDIVKETHRALNENRNEFYVLPTDADLLAQELLLFESSGSDDMEDFTDGTFRHARVALRTPFADGMVSF